jgi:hypothetical protein
MSAYQLQRAVFDVLRAAEKGAHRPPAGSYDLTPRELSALEGDDLREMALLGVHPVLINAYARACGIPRGEYKQMLAGTSPARGGRPRWRAS